jgi:hypothetical protein
MKKISILLLLVLTIGAELAAQSTLTIGQAVNMAGRQRMLSQRMAKARLYRTVGQMTDQAQKELNASQIIFDESLRALQLYAPTKAVRDRFDKVAMVWKDYKNALTIDSSRSGTLYVVSNNTQFLVLCDEAVQELVAYSRTLPNNEDFTNISGRMRMLSQRLTLYYGAHYFGLDSQAPDQMKKITDGIENGLLLLLSSEINTTEIDEALSNAIKDWDTIRDKCTNRNCYELENRVVEPVFMYETMNRFLNKMDKITAMYASLAKI